MAKTECGIVCIVSKIAITSYRLIDELKELQHRGRDSFGVSYYYKGIKVEKHQGLVRNLNSIFVSNVWIGHVRYSTSTKTMKYCQPIMSNQEEFSIVHNGNIKESIWDKIKESTEIKFDKYDSDTYKLMLLINHYILSKHTLETSLKLILNTIEGSYCFLVQTKDYIYVVRDRYGIKPLSYYREKNRIIVTSETKNLDSKPVERGTLSRINLENLEMECIYSLEEKKDKKKCIFEQIYFMRENTFFDDIFIKDWRQDIGRKLHIQTLEIFKNLKKEDVIVCGVPSSGIVYGESFSHYSGFEYNQFLKKREDYPHRTFILDTNDKRIDACKKKYFIDFNLENKVLILLDDSVVRGNTMKFLINYLKEFNPKEIHLLVGCPEIRQPCYYGVDFPDIEELISNKMNLDEMRNYFKLDSLNFLNLKSLKDTDSYCTACFDGSYMI